MSIEKNKKIKKKLLTLYIVMITMYINETAKGEKNVKSLFHRR